MSDKSALSRIDLKILVCDRSRYINNLWSQFGLSVLIDCYWDNGEKKRILFDSGWESIRCYTIWETKHKCRKY